MDNSAHYVLVCVAGDPPWLRTSDRSVGMGVVCHACGQYALSKVLLGEAPLAQMALIYSCSVDIKVSFGRIPLTIQIELKPYKDQRFSELKAQIDSTADEITW